MCMGRVCDKKGASSVESAMRARLNEFGLTDEIKFMTTEDCVGYCKQAPVMIVYPDNVLYGQVQVKDVPEIIEEHFLKGRPVKRLIDDSLDAQDVVANMRSTNFISKSSSIDATRRHQLCDPPSARLLAHSWTGRQHALRSEQQCELHSSRARSESPSVLRLEPEPNRDRNGAQARA